MKTGMSKIASGIPLRQTNPASVEKFLIEKVREDLGSFKDLAIITPVLRVDSEDGDLSGNITNGFGNVMLDVRGVKIHLPFIIHQKEMLPFDEIRMGDQKVAYDASKLRRIVNGIDKKKREEGDADEGDGDSFGIGELADPKDVRSGNGFLGTIMQIRDHEISRRSDGMNPWQGQDFGALDDNRLDRRASAEADVLDVFHEAVEKLAGVKVIPQQAVDTYLDTVEKRAGDESQKQIDAVSKVQPDSLEAAAVRRGMAKMKEEKLADVSRAASGNDIKFPIADQGRFEYRSGRVYHTVEPWAKNDKSHTVAPIARIVIDNHNGYKILKSTDKFMTTLDTPSTFNFRTEKTRGLERGKMYAMEISTDKISHPFMVEERYANDGLGHGIHFSDDDRRTNSLFMESFRCREVMPAKYTGDGAAEWTTTRSFTILLPRDETLQDVIHLNSEQLDTFIQEKAKDPVDAKLAKWMADAGGSDVYIIPHKQEFFKMEKAIEGHFTKPDGYFKEGPIIKQAAYDSLNKVTLQVERDNQPRSYALEWQYSDEVTGGDVAGSVQLQKRKLAGLTEDKARQLLMDLGYDNRRIEMFFEIAKRNGRSATFDLPDVEKAKALAPGDVAAQKRKQAFGNIAKATLNPQNFMPVLTDAMADGIAGVVGNIAPQTADWARSVGGWLKTSFETAQEIEKIATTLGGSTWHELAALTNLKHRLDKQASEVASGHYLSGMETVLEDVAKLAPAIEKHAHDLIEFNRQQILQYDKAPVAPKLIKQALRALDGLYRYASFHQASEDERRTLEKKAEEDGPHRLPVPILGEDVVGRSGSLVAALIPSSVKQETNQVVSDLMDRLNKTASEHLPGKSVAPSDELGATPAPIVKAAGLFGAFGDHTQQLRYNVGRYADLIGEAQGELDALQSKLRNAHIRMRAILNNGSPDMSAKMRLEEQIEDLSRQLQNAKEHLSSLGQSKGDQQQQLNNVGTGVSAAVGIPTLFGVGYADAAWKNHS